MLLRCAFVTIITELLLLLSITNANKHRRLTLLDPKSVEQKDDNLILPSSSESEPELTTNTGGYNRWSILPSSINKHPIPSALENLGDVSDIYTRDNKEVPFFWNVFKSGESIIKNLYSDCYGLVETAGNGILEGHQNDTNLEVVALQILNGWKFVNVDTITPSGIDRAAKFDTAKSGLVDIIVSPLPYEAVPKLFDSEHKGRFFTIFRDPVERVVSTFNYLKKVNYNQELAFMTLEEYAFSDLAESNFITRSLINKMEEDLVEKDFETAREILKRKCLVGLINQIEESVRRFDSYFGFRNVDKEISKDCVEGYLNRGSNKNIHLDLPVHTSMYKELVRKNSMDIKLHKYAVELFQEQASMFGNTNSDAF